MTLAARYLSSDALGALARLLKDIKRVEELRWYQMEDRVRVGENILQKFVSSAELSKVAHLRNVLEYVEQYLEERPDSPVRTSSASELRQLFEESAPSASEDAPNRYAQLKQVARLSEDEQAMLSREAAGSYALIRRHPTVGYLISHLRVLDSYRREGLATCYISRRLVDEAGEIVAEGSVWQNKGHLHIIGYERFSTHLSSLQVEPRREGYLASVGFVSGYERNGVPFTTKVIMLRASAKTRYGDVRESTGGASNTDDALRMAEGLGIPLGEDLEDFIEVLDDGSYVTVASGH